jgi:hypothetical protein
MNSPQIVPRLNNVQITGYVFKKFQVKTNKNTLLVILVGQVGLEPTTTGL